MDQHFSDMLATPSGDRGAKRGFQGEAFISSKSFAGRREGYVFRNGSRGVGYYVDSISSKEGPGGEAPLSKRSREGASYGGEEDEEDLSSSHRRKSSSHQAAEVKVDIEELLEEADRAPIEPLNQESLQQVCSTHTRLSLYRNRFVVFSSILR